MTEPYCPDRDALADYAGQQTNARRDAEYRIATALDVCRQWEDTADEYDPSAERAEGGDPLAFSLVPILIARIRHALTQPVARRVADDDSNVGGGAVSLEPCTVTPIRATSVESDKEHGMWYIHVLDAPIHHTYTDVHTNVDRDADNNIVGVEILGCGCNRGNEVTS